MTRCYLLVASLILTVLLSYKISSGAKILFINNIGLRSHLIVFSAYIEALADRGHDVTLLTSLPYEGRATPNVTQHELVSEVITNNYKAHNRRMGFFSRIFPTSSLFVAGLEIFEPCAYLENNVIENLINSTVTYDVALISGYYTECFMGLTYMKNIPVITVTPSLVTAWHNTALGIANNYGLDKYFYLTYPDQKLLHRLYDNIAGNFIYAYRNWLYEDKINNWWSTKFPSHKLPPFQQLQNNISLVMTNTIPEMGYVRVTVPKLIEVGGMHCRPSKKLPQHLEEFIAGAGEHGVVYLSLGSTIRLSSIPKYVVEGFMEVFKEIPQRVIWKWAEELPNVPKNVMVSAWLPQQDILGDPRLRAFVTQGGMLSLQEAVFHGVPVIAIPFVSDQYLNTAIVQNMGYGLQLTLESFTTGTFRKFLKRVIEEKQFKLAANKLSEAVKDAPQNSTEKAVWWIEYVIRNRGTPFLTHPMEGMTWCQHRQLDVQAILIIASLLILSGCYILTKRFFKFLRKHLLYRQIKLKKL